MRILLLCVLLVLIGALPAGAGLLILDDSEATVSVNIPGYTTEARAAGYNNIRTAIQAATAPTDTVYIHEYVATNVRVAGSDWQAGATAAGSDSLTIYWNPDGAHNWVNTSNSAGIITLSGSVDGIRFINMEMSFTGGGAGIVMAAGSNGHRFTNCSWSGDGYGNIYNLAGQGANDYVFNGCTFGTTVASATAAEIQFLLQSASGGWRFYNCVFDYDETTPVAALNVMRIYGAHDWKFYDCDFRFPTNATTTSLNGLMFADTSGTYGSGNIELTRCSITTATPTAGAGSGIVAVTFGGAQADAADAVTDSILIQGCTFTGPNDALANALKFETVDNDTWSNHISVIGNTFRGWHISVGALEATEGAVISNNKIVGMLTGSGYGIALQSAHNVDITNNDISNCFRAIGFSTGQATRKNKDTRISGNLLTRNTYAYHIALPSDINAPRIGGNVLVGNTYIARDDSNAVNYSTIAAWQGYAPPGLPADWVNGWGDTIALPGEIDAGLRRAGVFGGGSNQLGVSGKGLIK